MSWFKLNDSLNTLKGQISNVSNVVQEVFAEGTTQEESNTERIQEAEQEIENLTSLCKNQDAEITSLRRQIQDFQQQSKLVESSISAKSLPDNNAALEESWFWDTEQTASSSSSKENETVSPKSGSRSDLTIIPLETTSSNTYSSDLSDKLYRIIDERDNRIKQIQQENLILNEKNSQLTIENSKTKESIEELDRQHEESIEKLLNMKQEIQTKCNVLQKEQEIAMGQSENLKQKYAELQEKKEKLEKTFTNLNQDNLKFQEQIDSLSEKLNEKCLESEKLQKILEEKERESAEKFEYIEVDKDKLISEDELQMKIRELQQLTVEFEQLNVKYNALEENVILLKKEKDDHENESMELKNRNTTLENTLAEMRQIRDAKMQIESEYNTLQEDDLILQKEFYELKKSNTLLRDDSAAIKQDYNELNEKYENLLKSFDDIKTNEKSSTWALEEEFESLKQSASESESRLIQENVILQKQVIDLQSSLNIKSTQKTGSTDGMMSFDDFNKILQSSLQNSTAIDLTDGFESTIQSIVKHLNTLSNTIEELVEAKEISSKFTTEINKLRNENENLLEKKKELEHVNETIQADLHHYEVEVNEMMKNNELLQLEIEILKSGKLETIPEQNEENVIILEKQLEDCSKLNQSLEDEYADLRDKLNDLETEKEVMMRQIEELNNQIQVKNANLDEMKIHLDASNNEKCNLQFELNEIKTDDSKMVLEEQLINSKAENISLKNQLETLNIDHADLVGKLQTMQKSSIEKDNQYKENLQQHMDLLTKKDNDVKELIHEIQSLKLEIENDKLINNKSTEPELNELKNQLELIKNECLQKEKSLAEINRLYSEQEEKNSNLIKEIEVSKNQVDELQLSLSNLPKIEELSSMRQNIEELIQEKTEMIALITTKHQENVQYHLEIQRLDGLLKEQIEKSKNCGNCLVIAQELDEAKRKLSNMDKLQDQVAFLREKSDILTQNLLTEQTHQKLLNQEKMEIMEEKNNLAKELERLREHLMEIEENHTQETLEMQRIIEEAKTKMSHIEEEAQKSSTAYTSASIRANQQTETLQAQYALLIQQRDELLAKLSGAEDKESKNEAALINLQCALEQFQKNKDRDIDSATYRIRKEVEKEKQLRANLKEEMDILKNQLQESQTGLLAAGRLSDQLELCQNVNTALKDEVRVYKDKFTVIENKLKETELSHADKVEKGLLKNLLIGYIATTNNNDKSQILKLISSVLDFTQSESDKIGLNKNHTGWLSSIANISSNNTGNYNKEGIAQAFVKFLEKESQPRQHSTGGANLLNIVQHHESQSTSSTTKSATPTKEIESTSSGQAPQNHAIQPILLTDNVLQSFTAPRNSSSILKDILNDS